VDNASKAGKAGKAAKGGAAHEKPWRPPSHAVRSVTHMPPHLLLVTDNTSAVRSARFDHAYREYVAAITVVIVGISLTVLGAEISRERGQPVPLELTSVEVHHEIVPLPLSRPRPIKHMRKDRHHREWWWT
jgi:hypothetical protein